MFKRKREKKIERVLCICKNGCYLYHGSVLELPIADDQVIAGSIKFYDDPEPCMIHRSAVVSRYYMEIEAWLDDTGYESGSPVELDDIPEAIRVLLDLAEDQSHG